MLQDIKIGVMGGGGHIGLVYAACLSSLGYPTVAYDPDAATLENIKKGCLPFYEPGLEEMVNASLQKGSLVLTDQPEELRYVDVVYICTGTPSLADGKADISRVEQAVLTLARVTQNKVVVIQKSTVPVGTARHLIMLLSGKKLDGNISLVSSPEFLAEGTAVENFWKPDRVVAGAEDPEAADIAALLYLPPGVPVVKTSWENAELIKHASNALLSTKISFINEIARLCEKVEANVREISRGVGLDPRIGPHFLEAGAGFSGPCLEKDLRSLLNQFRKAGEEAPLLKSVLLVNQRQRRLLVKKLEKHTGDLKGKKIGILGLAFKPGTDDVRDSQSLPVIQDLLDRGAEVMAHDPLVLKSRQLEWFKNLFPRVALAETAYGAAQGSHGLLVLTAWPEYSDLDPELLSRVMAAPVIVDGRNTFCPAAMLVQGFNYEGVGV